MIAHLRGSLVHKTPGFAVIEVNGVGYHVWISVTTFYQLPDLSQPVTLYTHTYVREDALQLYGFSNLLEREIFQMLIGVSGIGPKLALNVLSGISSEDLIRSLIAGDTSRLMAIPGVGRKTAQRMLLDLREKAYRLEDRLTLPTALGSLGGKLLEDIVSALVNLGYKKTEAESTVEGILQKNPGISLENALRESLHDLSTR